MSKDKLVKTYFFIPEELWQQVEKFNQQVHLSSDAAAARLLLVLGLRNEASFKKVTLSEKMTTKGIAFQQGLREEIFRFQHRHYIDDKQTAYCQLIHHGLKVADKIFN